jgi:CDP-glucose 4,6-dehydratase
VAALATLESLGLMPFGGCYRGRRVLVTGHTGFKGSWLALWLTALGAEVSGLALAPDATPNHWSLLRLSIQERTLDLRDAPSVAAALAELQPEIVFHLAAQSLVRPSYTDPLGTWSTNVMGTAHLLEACRQVSSVHAVVVVTSDKCYENRGCGPGYREDDRLGGHDPYSASKASCELVAASWRQAFFEPAGRPALATARAGNVIGGGDWSQDRLLPDLVRAVAAGRVLEVRSPNATRPWQHVLESLSGYLVLGQRLLAGEAAAASAWNFGPAPADSCAVKDVLARLQGHWPQLAWQLSEGPHPHEAQALQLDSAKAEAGLHWRPVWLLDQALAATAAWYQAFLRDGELRSRGDIADYQAAAAAAGLAWAGDA